MHHDSSALFAESIYVCVGGVVVLMLLALLHQLLFADIACVISVECVCVVMPFECCDVVMCVALI